MQCDYVSSCKPTILKISPSSISSSSETPKLSQPNFQPPFSIPLVPVSPATSQCTTTFPSSPTPTAHPPFSTSHHHLVPHPPSKVLSTTPGSSLYVAQHIIEEIQTSPSVVPHEESGLIPLDLLAKTAMKLFLELGFFVFS